MDFINRKKEIWRRKLIIIFNTSYCWFLLCLSFHNCLLRYWWHLFSFFFFLYLFSRSILMYLFEYCVHMQLCILDWQFLSHTHRFTPQMKFLYENMKKLEIFNAFYDPESGHSAYCANRFKILSIECLINSKFLHNLI